MKDYEKRLLKKRYNDLKRMFNDLKKEFRDTRKSASEKYIILNEMNDISIELNQIKYSLEKRSFREVYLNNLLGMIFLGEKELEGVRGR